MMRRTPRLELIVLLYFLSYAPYAVCTKLLTTVTDPSLGRPLLGLEILPITLLVSSIGVGLAVWFSGWWRVVPLRKLGPFTVFRIRPPLWWAGFGATLLLLATPLSYTFPNVSIPTVQLLMRGDVLVIAPLVDLIAGRRVRWYSIVALGLVLVPLVITLATHGVFSFPPLLIVVVAAYTIGYFIRLRIMTSHAKTEDPDAMKLYFVEERLISIPMVLILLAAFALAGGSDQADQVAWGFTSAWASPALPGLLFIAFCLFLITFFAAMVLLDKRENSYCVPLERSASVLAGIAATYVLGQFFGMKMPSDLEVFSAVILIVAIVVLALGPRLPKTAEIGAA